MSTINERLERLEERVTQLEKEPKLGEEVGEKVDELRYELVVLRKGFERVVEQLVDEGVVQLEGFELRDYAQE